MVAAPKTYRSRSRPGSGPLAIGDNVCSHDVRPVLLEERVTHIVNAGDIATENLIVLTPEEDLNSAMQKISVKDIEKIPVVKNLGTKNLIVMFRRRYVIKAYNRVVLKRESGIM